MDRSLKRSLKELLRSAGAGREVTLCEVRTAVLLVRTTHSVSTQGAAAPVTALEVRRVWKIYLGGKDKYLPSAGSRFGLYHR